MDIQLAMDPPSDLRFVRQNSYPLHGLQGGSDKISPAPSSSGLKMRSPNLPRLPDAIRFNEARDASSNGIPSPARLSGESVAASPSSVPHSPLMSPRSRVRTGVASGNANFSSDLGGSQTKIKTNGSLPRNLSGAGNSASSPVLEDASGGASPGVFFESSQPVPQGTPLEGLRHQVRQVSEKKVDETIRDVPGQQKPRAVELPPSSLDLDNFPLIDSDEDPKERNQTVSSAVSKVVARDFLNDSLAKREHTGSSLSFDAPAQTGCDLPYHEERTGKVLSSPLRRHMSLRVTSGPAANSLSTRRYAQSLQVIGEIKRQLQELDVHQSEVMVELDLERALLESECSRVLSDRSRPPSRSSHPGRNVSPLCPGGQQFAQKQELILLRQNVETLETELKQLDNMITSLKNRPTPSSEINLEIRHLQEECDFKRRQYENLEYRLLEAELAHEDAEALNPAPDSVVTEELQALDMQMRTLLQQTQTQTNSLSQRRHVLLDQLKAEYRTLHKISEAQAQAVSYTVRSDHPLVLSPVLIHTHALPNGNDLTDFSPRKSLSPDTDKENTNTLDVVRRKSHETSAVSRPLTRYLPQPSPLLNLEEYLESCGHDLEYCRAFVQLTKSSCSGYMSKLSSLGHLPLWRKRFFVLDRNAKTLSYGKSRSMRSGVTVIGFHEIEDVYVLHDSGGRGGSSSRKVSGNMGKTTFCVTSCQRRYLLQAPDAAVMRLWVEATSTGAEGSAAEYWQKV